MCAMTPSGPAFTFRNAASATVLHECPPVRHVAAVEVQNLPFLRCPVGPLIPTCPGILWNRPISDNYSPVRSREVAKSGGIPGTSTLILPKGTAKLHEGPTNVQTLVGASVHCSATFLPDALSPRLVRPTPEPIPVRNLSCWLNSFPKKVARQSP